MKLKDMTIEEQMEYLLMYNKSKNDNHIFDEFSDSELVEEVNKAKELLQLQEEKYNKEDKILGSTFKHSEDIAYEKGKRKYSKKQIRESEETTNKLLSSIKEDWIRENKVSKVDSDFSNFSWDLLDDEKVSLLMKSQDFTLDEQYMIYYIYCIKSYNIRLFRKQIAFRGIKDTIHMYDTMKGKKLGYGDSEFSLSLNKSLHDIGKSILEDEELRKELDWTYIDIKDKRSKAGKKKAKTIEITYEFDKKLLAKYKLTVGQEFSSCSELAKYCGFSTSQQISKWKKLGYVQTVVDSKKRL